MNKNEYNPPYEIIPIPLNKEGNGPEIDRAKVTSIIWEIWDCEMLVVSKHSTWKDAIEAKRLLEEKS